MSAYNTSNDQTCRMYRDVLPEVNDVVITRISDVMETGSYATLPEYNNIAGYISISEYSKSRIRSIAKIVNVNKLVIAQVVAVNKEKQLIDLSKKIVHGSDINACKDWFERSKIVHNIVRKCAQKRFAVDASRSIADTMLDIYQTHIWELYNKAKREHAYDVLKSIINGKGTKSHTLPDDLLSICEGALRQKTATISGHCELFYAGFEGIDWIIEVCKHIRQQHENLKINYGASGEYVFSKTTDDIEAGITQVNNAMRNACEMLQGKTGGVGIVKRGATSNIPNVTVHPITLELKGCSTSDYSDSEEEDDE